MKDFRIDGVLQRVFVLAESDVRVVYIPVKALHRVDYNRLLEMEARNKNLLQELNRTVLDNGANALVLYEKIIQVFDKASGKRLKKPEEKIRDERLSINVAESVKESVKEVVQNINSDGVVRNKPGRKSNAEKAALAAAKSAETNQADDQE